MTYKELLTFLQGLDPEQLDQEVAIYDYNSDDYHPVNEGTFTVGAGDVLEDNHPILTINSDAIFV